MTFCANCKVFQERAAEAGRKLEEQEGRFQKAKADFEARAKQILDSQAQHQRVISQLREEARQAREDRDNAINAATRGRAYDEDDATRALNDEVERLKRELQDKVNKLDLATTEVDKLKGRVAQPDYDENDPDGWIARIRAFEID